MGGACFERATEEAGSLVFFLWNGSLRVYIGPFVCKTGAEGVVWPSGVLRVAASLLALSTRPHNRVETTAK